MKDTILRMLATLGGDGLACGFALMAFVHSLAILLFVAPWPARPSLARVPVRRR